MSRPAHAAPPSTPAAVRRGPGRHRLDRPAGVRCSDLPMVRERLERSGASRPRNAVLRWLAATAPAGRHSWQFLAASGGRPRTAFAIILSL
ncbi:hypothetical protein SAMN06893096_104322 [Geodermatophilus pulveris]|uniref:Uncharacterized protein n=1 Tax=Geodermatophilus pulveris TaxID=1564159 RepID=A0A239EVF8_9ACTN|nr:hypothetical protein [Geodermatophilus pulveris]SNS48599.1 hypothetical protein SAMN06893096_104322 [Geodermatophilus pulveris]